MENNTDVYSLPVWYFHNYYAPNFGTKLIYPHGFYTTYQM